MACLSGFTSGADELRYAVACPECEDRASRTRPHFLRERRLGFTGIAIECGCAFPGSLMRGRALPRDGFFAPWWALDAPFGRNGLGCLVHLWPWEMATVFFAGVEESRPFPAGWNAAVGDEIVCVVDGFAPETAGLVAGGGGLGSGPGADGWPVPGLAAGGGKTTGADASPPPLEPLGGVVVAPGSVVELVGSGLLGVGAGVPPPVLPPGAGAGSVGVVDPPVFPVEGAGTVMTGVPSPFGSIRWMSRAIGPFASWAAESISEVPSGT